MAFCFAHSLPVSIVIRQHVIEVICLCSASLPDTFNLYMHKKTSKLVSLAGYLQVA